MSETSRGLMISELVENHGYDAEQLNQLSDEDLSAELNIVEESGFMVDDSSDFEFEDSSNDTEATNDQIIPPAPTDPAWNDYVLSHLALDELQDGKPTVDGLRRLVELLIGDIEASTTTIKQSPSPENGWTATAVHHITVLIAGSNTHKCYSGAADSNPDNTDHPYNKYPTAIAETRAEARALRKLLRLRTASAEEVSVVAGSTGNTAPVAKVEGISDTQLNVIDMLSNTTRGKNVNIESLAISLFPSYNKIRNLTQDEGIELISALNKYQRGEKGYEAVPDSLSGYKEDWRNK